MKKQFLYSSAIVSLIALFSKLTSIYRAIFVAGSLGVSREADLFNFTDKFLKALYFFGVEGLCTQAIMPVLAEYGGEKKRPDREMLLGNVFLLVVVFLFFFTLLAVFSAPLWVATFAPGWYWRSDRYESACRLLQICFPVFATTALGGLLGVYLNLKRIFIHPAWVPIIINLSMIGVAKCCLHRGYDQLMAMCIGLHVSAQVVLIYQLVKALVSRSLVWPQKIDWDLPGIRKIRSLLPHVLLIALIGQISGIAPLLVGSFLKKGDFSRLDYAFKSSEILSGAISVGLTTLLFPLLSRRYQKQKQDPQRYANEFGCWLNNGLRVAYLLMPPAVIALSVLAYPLLFTLFPKAVFSDVDLRKIFCALQIYNFSAFPHLIARLLSLAYCARQKFKDLARKSFYASAFEIGVLLLLFPTGYLCLCWAYLSSGIVKALLLFDGLKQTGDYRPREGLFLFGLRTMIAGVLMTLALYMISPSTDWWLKLERSAAFSVLFCSLLAGTAVYAFSLWLSGMRFSDIILTEGGRTRRPTFAYIPSLDP